MRSHGLDSVRRALGLICFYFLSKILKKFLICFWYILGLVLREILYFLSRRENNDRTWRRLVGSRNSPGSVDVKDQWEHLSGYRGIIGHKRVMVFLGGKTAALLRKPNQNGCARVSLHPLTWSLKTRNSYNTLYLFGLWSDSYDFLRMLVLCQ